MKAFTLAETLITLGIIGVVAALTIPSLVSKYQHQVFSTAFKKQYSVLNNTIVFIELNDGVTECYHGTYSCPIPENPNNRCYTAKSDECLLLKERLISKLKLTKVNKNDFVYAKRDEVRASGGAAVLWSYNYDNNFDALNAYMLPDGAVLFFSEDADYSTANGLYLHVVFVVDVNGKKGPNKWGHDVFWLILSQKNGKLRLTDEYATLSEKGGSFPRNILINDWGTKLNNGMIWQ